MIDKFSQASIVYISIAIALATFIFDLYMPLGVAAGVPYIALVLVGLWSRQHNYIYLMAAIGTILTTLGYFVSTEGSAQWMVLTNRGLAIAAVWIAAILCARIIKNQSRFQTMVDTVVSGIITIDQKGIVQTFNKTAEQLFGYSSAEVMNQNISMLMPSPYKEEHDQYLHNYLQTGQKKIIDIGREVTGRRKDGSVFPMDLAVGEYEDVNGKHFIGVIRDLTKQKKSEEKIREANELNKQLIQTANIIILILDNEGRIVQFNPYMEKLSGYTLEEVQGKDWFSTFVPEAERDDIRKIFDESKSGTRTKGKSNNILAKDGREHLIEWFDNELHDASGNLIGILAIGQDITERAQTEARMLELQRELTMATRHSAVGELGTAIAHELNQPITALMNYVTACKRTLTIKDKNSSLDPAVLMDKVINEAERAAGIINHLREYVQTGELHKRPEDLNKVIQDSISLTFTQLHEVDIKIKRDLEPDLPLAHIDKIQIQQVIFNLLRNAIEALEQSIKREITIRTVLINKHNIEVMIQDTGPGVRSDILKHQLKKPLSSKENGMGIGLSICQSIIDSHHGTFWVTPTPGGGTTFHFTVAIVESEAK